jgi:hypothetical protein
MRTARRMGGPAARLVAAAIALAAAGCGPSGPPFSLALSWSFADGRTCADSGALDAVPSAGDTVLGPSGGFPCADGEAPSAVTVDGVPADASALDLRAETVDGTTLYRGALQLPSPPPASATVTLYFVQ